MLSSVEERMRDFKVWINEVKQSNLNTKVPMEIVYSLNDIFMEGVPAQYNGSDRAVGQGNISSDPD